MSDAVEKEGLWYRCVDFVNEQSAGEWDEKTIADDADKLLLFIHRELADRPRLLARVAEVEMRLSRTVQWLEEYQPDVFRRGLWNYVEDCAALSQTEAARAALSTTERGGV